LRAKRAFKRKRLYIKGSYQQIKACGTLNVMPGGNYNQMKIPKEISPTPGED
jgi:hypothetical protein